MDPTAGAPPLEPASRRALVTFAGRHGDLSTVRTYLDDPDPNVRIAALAALVRVGAAALAEVDAALRDADPRVRRAALEHGARLPRLELGGLLSDPDSRVVEAAAFAIGEHGDASSLEALVTVALAHDDPLARESAVAALGALGDGRGLGALLAALDDVATVRRRAVVALSAFDAEEVRAALRARLADRDWQVRQAAQEVLGLSDDPPR